MTTKNYKLIDDNGRSWNACENYFTVDADYKKLKSALGLMNSISDKHAGWEIQMADGTVICIFGSINDDDPTDDYHCGIDQGIWDVRSTDERAARKAVREIAA